MFPGKQSKSRAIWSAWQRLHDCGSGPTERAGWGSGWAHRPPGVQLQPHAAAVPVHAGPDARGISCMWLPLNYSQGQGRIGHFCYVKVLWRFNVFASFLYHLSFIYYGWIVLFLVALFKIFACILVTIIFILWYGPYSF